VLFAAPPQPVPQQIILAWPRTAQAAAVILLSVTAVLLAVNAWGITPLGARPSELERGESLICRLDLNHAPRAELLQVPGIGPKTAECIVQYRRTHGRFRKLEDLKKVGGIGPKKFKRIAAWVYVEPSAGEAAPAAELLPQAHPAAARMVPEQPAERQQPTSKKAVRQEKSYAGPKINVNTASAEELRKVKGIGPVLSKRIVEVRQVRPFASVDELKGRVSGIGKKTLDKLRPHLTVE
jgi:competence protein ComEA